MPVVIRPLLATETSTCELVAERMRQTLIEVVGKERGEAMYAMDWLVDRVRQHLDPQIYDGAVLLAEVDGTSVGHTIVRVETEKDGTSIGLFSTFFVVPERRGAGVFDALLLAGEAWMKSRHLPTARTYTAIDNIKLHRAMARHGYEPVMEKGEFVVLERHLP